MALLLVGWLAAWYQRYRQERAGHPDVMLTAPGGKPVVSLAFDPKLPGALLIAASAPDQYGGGAQLWLSTDVPDDKLPLTDLGIMGKLSLRRTYQLRAYGSKGGSALYSPNGKYIAIWNGKLSLCRNADMESNILYTIPTSAPFFRWEGSLSDPRLLYRTTDGKWVTLILSAAPLPKRYSRTPPLTSAIAPYEQPSPDTQSIFCDAIGLSALGNARGQVRLTVEKTHTILQTLTAGRVPITAIAWTKDGSQIAVGNRDGEIYRFQKNGTGHYFSAPQRSRFRHSQQPDANSSASLPSITALAFSQDNRTLASGGNDGMVYLWRF